LGFTLSVPENITSIERKSEVILSKEILSDKDFGEDWENVFEENVKKQLSRTP